MTSISSSLKSSGPENEHTSSRLCPQGEGSRGPLPSQNSGAPPEGDAPSYMGSSRMGSRTLQGTFPVDTAVVTHVPSSTRNLLNPRSPGFNLLGLGTGKSPSLASPGPQSWDPYPKFLDRFPLRPGPPLCPHICTPHTLYSTHSLPGFEKGFPLGEWGGSAPRLSLS